MSSDRPWVLGISLSHNGSVCLLHGSDIVVAVQEERLTRRKRARIDPTAHSLAVQYCLDFAGIAPTDLAAVGICSQPALSLAEGGHLLVEQLGIVRHGTPLVTLSHHGGHAVHAFATSGFSEAAVLVIDGMGSPAADLSDNEKRASLAGTAPGWESISLYECSGVALNALEKHLILNGEWLIRRDHGMPFFRSLGGMYSAVAKQIFGDEMDAGQVMGLAPYGRAEFPVADFFGIADGAFHFKDTIPFRFADDVRWPEGEERYRNLAASVQAALEHAVLALARRLIARTQLRCLCYAGGVALNVTANERLHRETPFTEIFIPAAAEDSGPALGAAFWGLWSLAGRGSPERIHRDSFGRPYALKDIDEALHAVPGMRCASPGGDVLEDCASRIAKGEIGGWFQGGSELGPRALGSRSILADPRDPETKTRLNARVKLRAAFRPFAPAVLSEHAADWFELAEPDDESEFMLRAWRVRESMRARVPAICHVDGTGRAQTVDARWAPRFHALIERFHRLTGVPMLVNTSFNVNKEPIVETPEDALWCFLTTGMDFCVLEDRLVTKVAGREILLDYSPCLVALEIAHPDETPTFRCRVATPWGVRQVGLSRSVAPVLNLIDGRRSVREIASELRQRNGEDIPELGLIDLLVYLKRSRILEFAARPT